MPAQIDYSEKGWLENIFDPGAWRNLLSDVGTIASDVSTTWEQIEKMEGSQTITPPSFSPSLPPPSYDPNLSASDFAFTPNVTLVAVGVGVLLLVLFLRK